MSLKSELKNGAVVECYYGEKFIFIDTYFVNKFGSILNLKRFTDDLKYVRKTPEDYIYDIDKINNNGTARALYEVLNQNKWTWERPNEILTEKEKEYLSAVIKPFRDRVIYVEKRPNNDDTEYISIVLKCGDDAVLPLFDIDTMYKGMELEKEYTLEDLGL